MDDVRVREEARAQQRLGRRVISQRVASFERKFKKDEGLSGDSNVGKAEDVEQELPIYPLIIHGGSVAADRMIRSKMIPGESMCAPSASAAHS
jgi:hypothetical protein